LVQKQVVQKPDVVGIVDVEAMVELQNDEDICPCRTNLSCDVCPQALDPHIMHTPRELNVVNVEKVDSPTDLPQM
jgi:hypothetical protein